jgi:hypothetical protein
VGNFVISEEIEEALSSAEDFNFQVFQFRDICEGNDLLNMSYYLFHKLDLFESLGIPPPTFHRFILEVQKGYRKNPYHN